MSKSEIVVPKLHVPGAASKQYTVKEEDSTTYTSLHTDKFAYGTEEEESDETNVKTVKKDSTSEGEESTIRESDTPGILGGCSEDSCSCSVQSKVHYFENYFKQVCYHIVMAVNNVIPFIIAIPGTY